MPAQAGIQPACVSPTALGLGPSLRWGDGCWQRRSKPIPGEPYPATAIYIAAASPNPLGSPSSPVSILFIT